jgi:LemA protein
MRVSAIGLVRLAAAGFGLVLLAGCSPGDVPALEQRARLAWSEVQNQRQRRAQLVPQLVEVVRRAAPQEQDLLRQVSEARARVLQVPVSAATVENAQQFDASARAEAALSAALARLLDATERYPELKSSAGFDAIRAQLRSAEDRIALAQRDYAAAAEAYNRALESWPYRWTGWFHERKAHPLSVFEGGSGFPQGTGGRGL